MIALQENKASNHVAPTTPGELGLAALRAGNLDAALEGRQILIEPNSPSRGVRVAFILDDGAPIELLEFDKPDLLDKSNSSLDC